MAASRRVSIPQLGLPLPPLFMVEPVRTSVELAALLMTSPLLAQLPRGDGHPVLVLPGMLGTDVSTLPLRRLLRHLGYPVHGWRAGRDVSLTTAVREGVAPALDRLTQRYGEPASVIGWCVGGLYARRMARTSPRQVRQVITLGTPFGGDLVARRPLAVPSTAVYSRTDGMVPWTACRTRAGRRTESVAVYSSHLGFGHNPSVLMVIADRLAQDIHRWKPFAPPPALSAIYPSAA